MSISSQRRTIAYVALGNVRQIVDSSDNVVAYYEYDPFGKLISKGGTYVDANRYRHATKPYDEDTGLYYYTYRHYNPESGRWINRDPISEEGGLNLYAFCLNSVINGIDLFGSIFIPDPKSNKRQQEKAKKLIEKVLKSRYAEDKSSAVYNISRDKNNVVKVFYRDDSEGAGGYNRAKNQITINEYDVNTNSGYTLLNRKGVVSSGKNTFESIFIHEARHAYDYAMGIDMDKRGDYSYGINILETDSNAVDEENLYRAYENMDYRIWYNDLEDFKKYYASGPTPPSKASKPTPPSEASKPTPPSAPTGPSSYSTPTRPTSPTPPKPPTPPTPPNKSGLPNTAKNK